MAKEPRQEELQRLVCPKCGNNKKFTGENAKRKVFLQNFKYTDYRKQNEDGKEIQVVSYSPTYSDKGKMGYDVIYCADIACVEKNHGTRVHVWARRGVNAAVRHDEDGDED